MNIKITYKYREPLIKIFGISALAIGIISFIKVNCLPCVILALILGFILGEFFDLDTKLKNLLAKIIYKLNFKHKFKNEEEKNLYMDFYLLVAATFALVALISLVHLMKVYLVILQFYFLKL